MHLMTNSRVAKTERGASSSRISPKCHKSTPVAARLPTRRNPLLRAHGDVQVHRTAESLYKSADGQDQVPATGCDGDAMTAAAQWIREHDDRLSFVVLYISGAILLSIVLNLFWVMMLMLAHFVLEIVRGYLLKVRQPFFHAVWEVKLDIGLVLFALVVALYAEHVLALLGLGQVARAGQAVRGLEAAARFGVIERALRVVALTIDDFARLAQAAVKFGTRKNEPATAPPSAHVLCDVDPGPKSSTGIGDVLSLSFVALCLILITVTPSLTGKPGADVTVQIGQELSPYR